MKTDANEKNSTQEELRNSDIQRLLHSLRLFLRGLLSIRQGVDIEGSIAGIKKDIIFQGPSIWILIASIFIASIGLNTNSTPVVIGAMLISPLMGPILGIGLSVGTYDWETLLRSLKYLGIAVGISLLTSWFYFSVSPLSEAQSELLARTKPTSLDVLLAFFGGAAGIIAGSRREKSNVVPGVAIATALMPPLCTAGYGLAIGNFHYFFGAFYLFFLNSVFITLATLIGVRYLGFPPKNQIDKNAQVRIKRYIIVFVIIVILPSAQIFWNVVKESRFNSRVNLYLKENVHFQNSEVINKKVVYNDTLSIIHIYAIGEEIPESKIKSLNDLLRNYGLDNSTGVWKNKGFAVTDKTVLQVHQSIDDNTEIFGQIEGKLGELSKQVRAGILEDIYKKNEKVLADKEEQIAFLEKELLKQRIDTLPLKSIEREIKVQYPKIRKFSYAKSIEMTFDGTQDTIQTFLVNWKRGVWRAERKRKTEKLAAWLRVRLELDTVRIIRY